MDICSKAFQGEITGRLVADAAAPGTQASSALRAATGLAYALGDFVWPGTWFLMSAARRTGQTTGHTEETLDVAA